MPPLPRAPIDDDNAVIAKAYPEATQPLDALTRIDCKLRVLEALLRQP